jgi:hypothetical protein
MAEVATWSCLCNIWNTPLFLLHSLIFGWSKAQGWFQHYDKCTEEFHGKVIAGFKSLGWCFALQTHFDHVRYIWNEFRINIYRMIGACRHWRMVCGEHKKGIRNLAPGSARTPITEVKQHMVKWWWDSGWVWRCVIPQPREDMV